jgi:hypothetical protein
MHRDSPNARGHDYRQPHPVVNLGAHARVQQRLQLSDRENALCASHSLQACRILRGWMADSEL